MLLFVRAHAVFPGNEEADALADWAHHGNPAPLPVGKRRSAESPTAKQYSGVPESSTCYLLQEAQLQPGTTQ